MKHILRQHAASHQSLPWALETTGELVSPTSPWEAWHSGESVITQAAFLTLCAYLAGGVFVDAAGSIMLSVPSHFLQSSWYDTGSVWLKRCNKSSGRSWKPPGGVIVKRPPATVFVGCVLHYVYTCVCLHACSSWSPVADRSLAEWLTTGWGAVWWSCQPCCVAFSWQWLSWHSHKHIRMRLLSHPVWVLSGKIDQLAHSFHFHDCPSKASGDVPAQWAHTCTLAPEWGLLKRLITHLCYQK